MIIKVMAILERGNKLEKILNMLISEAFAKDMKKPGPVGKSFYGSKRSLHIGGHDEDYYDAIIGKQIKEIMDRGIKKKYQQAQYRKDVLKLLADERKNLIEGKTQLNKAQALHDKIKMGKKTK